MDIIPAIDLLGGKCVRLVQGRYDRVIHYERDPLEVAEAFLSAGARRMHVVDLDGARSGEMANLAALKRLAATGARIEFGGGVRDERAVSAALSAGAECVIVGTRALEDWAWFTSVVHNDAFRNRIALGLDARLGKLVVRGWTQEVHRTAVEVAEALHDWPLASIIYTDVGRDGMLLGPNVEAICGLASISPIPVVAAGGVTDLDDVRRLSQLKLGGVVIGRAIYERTIDLKAAIAAAAGR